jgi:hypothetical protein
MHTGWPLALTTILAAGGAIALARPAEQAAAAAVRTQHAVGYYDDARQRVVLVGGPADPREGERDRVWSLNGARWELETEAGPAGRVNAAAVYDRRHEQAVVSGGSRKAAEGDRWDVVGDTWVGDRRGWRRVGDMTPRDHQSLVVDGRGRVLMFGGIGADRSTDWPHDTWVLDEGRWSRVATDGPAGRGRSALAYDARRRRVVLFGGASAPSGPDRAQTFFGDTWTWDGERWQRVAETGPRGRYAHAMVFDEAAGVVLLYGGAAAHRDAPLSDMWKWDGTACTVVPLAGPTPGHRYQPVLVYDRAGRRTILHGGIGTASDTWEWNGTRWRPLAP